MNPAPPVTSTRIATGYRQSRRDLGRFRHHPQVRRPRPPKRSTIITWIVVLLLALAGTIAYVLIKLDVFAPSLSEQISSIQEADGSWWLGTTFEGLPITLAEPASGDRVNDIGYGACERFGSKLDPFTSTRCGYPLLLQVRKRRYDIALDELPKQLDGNCAKTTVRGAPVVVAPGGAILYTADLAIAVLGRPEQVGRALARVRPVSGAAKFQPPSPGVAALDNCIEIANPFAPLAQRITELRAEPGLPLVWVGEWYAGGRLTGAERTGKTAVLTYTSCGRSSSLGACLETLSLSSQAADLQDIHSTLDGATCRTFTVAGAPGVAWTKDLAGETGAGVYVFTGKAAISLANDITLETIPISRVEAVARLVKPLPPATQLPAPTYDPKRLVAACAERTPLS
jgi:hypothetical protein